MVATQGPGWCLAPSLVAFIDQADATWPKRSTASDGSIASSAHHSQNPTSDHEIGARDIVHAVDLTHDPVHAVDMWEIANSLINSRDVRIKYVIAQSPDRPGVDQICSLIRGWHDLSTNHHANHLHLSIQSTILAENGLQPWALIPNLHPTTEDDLVTPDDIDKIANKVISKFQTQVVRQGVMEPIIKEAVKELLLDDSAVREKLQTIAKNGAAGAIRDAGLK